MMQVTPNSCEPGMPNEHRADMPAQDLHHFSADQVRQPINPSAVRSSPWRRILVLGGALVISALAINEMRAVLGIGGLTPLEYVVLVLFALTFCWITVAFTGSIAGFFSVLARSNKEVEWSDEPLTTRTAVLMPTYNEDPARLFAGLEAMARQVVEAGGENHFDWCIISDTTDANMARKEEQAVTLMRQNMGDKVKIYYRRRRKNIARKSGNVEDFCVRWGSLYDHLLVLDADSLMSGRVMVEMARRMQKNPDLGLLQTIPRLINGTTIVARLQQFAGRVYGPIVGSGLSWWTQKEGNFWGHNAIIRTKAFMQAAGLPKLPGKPPFGGYILSHDFVEAALLRRSGWSVEIAHDLNESYEESPPSIVDLAVRDRRWCQGNLQHTRVIGGKRIHWVSRMHIMTGIMSYLSSPLWLMLIIAGLLLALQYQFVRPEYFPQGYSLFPTWPLMDPERALRLFVVTMGILFGPKVLGLISFLWDKKCRREAGGFFKIFVSFIVEMIVSALIAPIMMLIHSGAVTSIVLGQDSGWNPQRRDDGRIPWKALWYRHRWHVIGGIVLAVSSYVISLDVLAWLSPAIIGMVLAVPLSSWTGSNKIGRVLKRWGILKIPEEAQLPSIWQEMEQSLKRYEQQLAQTPSLADIASDKDWFNIHMQLMDSYEPRVAGDVEEIDATAAIKIADAHSIEQAVSFLNAKEQARVQNTPALMQALADLPRTEIPRLNAPEHEQTSQEGQRLLTLLHNL
ncbi:glucans biosynthesis glucosyltransferase MdoH [Celerinatantimonas sp. MCCC 1A17872]|uniref:glucans biosynthesis glucosyltransferase MdoH n=1 Tax=Celerinatantimonas sp. MCCC 1A17872 TaxID=3177514 RepID=UPI0038C5959B